MTVESNEMIEKINSYGYKQIGSSPENLGDSQVQAFLLSMDGEKIAKFSAKGKIMSESMSVSEGQYAKGSITIKEIIK